MTEVVGFDSLFVCQKSCLVRCFFGLWSFLRCRGEGRRVAIFVSYLILSKALRLYIYILSREV